MASAAGARGRASSRRTGTTPHSRLICRQVASLGSSRRGSGAAGRMAATSCAVAPPAETTRMQRTRRSRASCAVARAAAWRSGDAGRRARRRRAAADAGSRPLVAPPPRRAMRSIICTTRTGWRPEAVSAESITASAPLNTAVGDVGDLGAGRLRRRRPCSRASASRRSPACRRARPSSSSRSWAIGTASGSSSTPRSPRATMIPSAAATISSMFSIASGFSIFAISRWASRPAASRAARRGRRRGGRTTARGSRRPSASAKRGVLAVLLGQRGRRDRRAGQVDPLVVAQRSRRARPGSATSSPVDRGRPGAPAARRRAAPGCRGARRRASPAYWDGMSAGPPTTSRVVTVTVSPSAQLDRAALRAGRRGSSGRTGRRGRRRGARPRRRPRARAGRRRRGRRGRRGRSSAARRRRPAASSSRTVAGSLDAGPSVATIFVRRRLSISADCELGAGLPCHSSIRVTLLEAEFATHTEPPAKAMPGAPCPPGSARRRPCRCSRRSG